MNRILLFQLFFLFQLFTLKAQDASHLSIQFVPGDQFVEYSFEGLFEGKLYKSELNPAGFKSRVLDKGDQAYTIRDFADRGKLRIEKDGEGVVSEWTDVKKRYLISLSGEEYFADTKSRDQWSITDVNNDLVATIKFEKIKRGRKAHISFLEVEENTSHLLLVFIAYRMGLAMDDLRLEKRNAMAMGLVAGISITLTAILASQEPDERFISDDQ